MLDKFHGHSHQHRLLVCVAAFVVCLLLVFIFCSITETADFGNVPAVAGYGCWEEITDCTGDTDLLTIDSIDWSRSTDGKIAVRTTPMGVLSFCSQPLDNEGFAIGDGDERGLHGYAEKKIRGKWEYVGKISIDFVANASYGMGGSAVPDAFYSFTSGSSDGWTWRELKIGLPEYEPGTAYRITYFFRQELENGWSNELYAISHTVRLPGRTDSRFDFISLGWECSVGSAICPEIRVNHGSVPYLLLCESYQEYKKGEQWIKEKAFEGEGAYLCRKTAHELKPCWRTSNHYNILPGTVHVFASDFQNPPTDYRLTLVFCDNADGSGEQYTLTLYLNTEILAEYK